jgi:hypothetical protein
VHDKTNTGQRNTSMTKTAASVSDSRTMVHEDVNKIMMYGFVHVLCIQTSIVLR